MRAVSIFSKVLAFVLVTLILFYKRAISPLFPRVCRFYPSCSTYMLESIKKYGAVKGCMLGIKRISRCHPLHKGGYDPVP